MIINSYYSCILAFSHLITAVPLKNIKYDVCVCGGGVTVQVIDGKHASVLSFSIFPAEHFFILALDN